MVRVQSVKISSKWKWTCTCVECLLYCHILTEGAKRNRKHNVRILINRACLPWKQLERRGPKILGLIFSQVPFGSNVHLQRMRNRDWNPPLDWAGACLQEQAHNCSKRQQFLTLIRGLLSVNSILAGSAMTWTCFANYCTNYRQNIWVQCIPSYLSHSQLADCCWRRCS